MNGFHPGAVIPCECSAVFMTGVTPGDALLHREQLQPWTTEMGGKITSTTDPLHFPAKRSEELSAIHQVPQTLYANLDCGTLSCGQEGAKSPKETLKTLSGNSRKALFQPAFVFGISITRHEQELNIPIQ